MTTLAALPLAAAADVLIAFAKIGLFVGAGVAGTGIAYMTGLVVWMKRHDDVADWCEQ